MGVLGLLVVVAALVLSRARGILLLTAIYPALVATLFTVNAFRIYWNSGVVAGVQGRYLFSGLTFLALALAHTWGELRRRGGHRAGVLGAGVVVLAAAAATLGGYMFAFRVRWLGADTGLLGAYRDMVQGGPVATWGHATLVVAVLLVSVAAASTIVHSAALDVGTAMGGAPATSPEDPAPPTGRPRAEAGSQAQSPSDRG